MNFVKMTFAFALVLVMTATGLWADGAEEEPAAAADKQYVTDPTTGKVVVAPEYGGTLTYSTKSLGSWGSDPYFAWLDPQLTGVVEKLGIGNWGIDRDEWDFSGPTPVSYMTGRLAESWEMLDDTTYVFHIRKGVRWHDKPPMNGRELTAYDVEYNFHRMLGLGSGFTEPAPPTFGVGFVAIPFESVEATDKWTVVCKLKEPYLPALRLILIDQSVYIMPPEVIKEHGDVRDWRNVVGTGPFMLTDLVEESSITRTKNPDYWGYDEKYPQNRLPYVDELEYLYIPEEATLMAALRSAKLDLRGPSGGAIFTIDQAESLQRTNPEIVLHKQWWRSNGVSFALVASKPPFDDIRVRKAMQMALDLETFNNTFFKGQANATPQGMVGVPGYYIPFEEWPEEVKKGYMYDPARAEALLDAAGYPRGADGIRFKTILHFRDVYDLGYSEIARSYWAEIGVDLEIDVYTGAEIYERTSSDTFEGMMTSIAGFQTFDPLSMVGWFHSDADSIWDRVIGHQDPVMDSKIEAAQLATTLEEQQRLIREADMYTIEKQWQIWGPKSPVWWALQPWVIGYNGETMLGPQEDSLIMTRLWVDSELKEAMGY